MFNINLLAGICLLLNLITHSAFALPPHLVGTQKKELGIVKVIKKNSGKIEEKTIDLHINAKDFKKSIGQTKNRKKTLISTASVGDTKGDISAASKLISYLLKDSDLKAEEIVWIISEAGLIQIRFFPIFH
ncbi:MAG: hypothetical protein AB8G05_25255 [Oligoflexales bacterium]